MRKSLAALGVLAGILLVPRPVLASGDKLAVLGRGIRFQRMLATKHATILVYLNPTAGISAADREYELRSVLKLAGHDPRAVTTPAELRAELGSGKYDVVLVDYADAARLERVVGTSRAKPTLIPVVYKATANQRAAAEKEYSCLISPAKKSYELLGVVDRAMVSRAGNSKSICKKNPA